MSVSSWVMLHLEPAVLMITSPKHAAARHCFTLDIRNLVTYTHYASSQTVDERITCIPVYYIDVQAKLDVDTLVKCVNDHLHGKHIYMIATVQFLLYLSRVRQQLIQHGFTVDVPQVSGLRPGEVLGCTVPDLLMGSDKSVILYVHDTHQS